MTVYTDIPRLNYSINNLLQLEPQELPEQIAKQAILLYLDRQIEMISSQSLPEMSRAEITNSLTNNLHKNVSEFIKQTLEELSKRVIDRLEYLTTEVKVCTIEYGIDDNISNVKVTLKVKNDSSTVN